MSPTPIDEERQKNTCLVGKGAACCSFLVMGPNGFACAKGSSFEEALLERRAKKSMAAMGDNCSGPPIFTATNE